jgi:hypothetical protein
MPTIFRRLVTPRGVGWRRVRRYWQPSAPSIRQAVFAMSGTATVPGVGASIASAVFAISGAATCSAAGVGIRSSVLAAAGAAAVAHVGQSYFTSVFTMAGLSSASFVKGLGQITSTNIIQKPVDYALAGEQDSPVRRGRAAGRGLRHTFGE